MNPCGNSRLMPEIAGKRDDLEPGVLIMKFMKNSWKMMAKDPTQRYQQPAEVVQALTICFKGKGNQPAAKLRQILLLVEDRDDDGNHEGFILPGKSRKSEIPPWLCNYARVG